MIGFAFNVCAEQAKRLLRVLVLRSKVCAKVCARENGRVSLARNLLIELVHPAGLEPAAF